MPTDSPPHLPGLRTCRQRLLHRATAELCQVLVLGPGSGVGPTQGELHTFPEVRESHGSIVPPRAGLNVPGGRGSGDVGPGVQDGSMPLTGFTRPTRAWFEESFPAPTPVQRQAWPVIRSGGNVLAVAPTGSGKTLAAFLWALDRCQQPAARPGVRVLYVSPLKALAVDVERNLRAPLAGIRARATSGGLPTPEVSVGMRTGDTSSAERLRLVRRPPDILITTPESLYLMLTSAARSTLAHVETVIIDEVHAVASTKRGSHLAVSLARLDVLVGRRVQRVGLSATVRPTEEAARYLGGDQPVAVVGVPMDRAGELTVQLPVEDLAEAGNRPGAPDEPEGRSVWPSVEERIVDLVEAHRSTIVFANSRRLAERLTARLNEIHAERLSGEPAPPPSAPAAVMAQSAVATGAPAILARAHHGSVSREQRALTEEGLKDGTLRAVVATSSLELGIDMGAVDLVIQVEAPPTVSSGLQRAGRAGHQVGGTSRAIVLPLHRSDLLTSAVVVRQMASGRIESLSVPANPLDVAAQQLVACVAVEDWAVADLFAMLRTTAPFASLTSSLFESVLDMLSGRYPADSFANLRPRLIWDRTDDMVRARPGAQRLAITSGGTIPDRGMFGVFHVSGGRVGELDEEMVYESRVGDRISLGAATWTITDITHDRVLVSPAPGAPGRLPFWRGDALGRSAELGTAIGQFTRHLARIGDEAAREELVGMGLDDSAAQNLITYVREEVRATGHVPSDRTIVVERTRDELGDWRFVVLTPFGARVHAPWALIVRERLGERFGVDANVLHGDEGIVARLPETADESALDDVLECLLVDPEDVAPTVTRLVGGSALFAARFRECASRALLLPRSDPARRSPLWQQRQRSAQLLAIAAEHPTFPIVLEAVRECLQDVYDLRALTELMTGVRENRVRVVEVSPPAPSPFAQSLLFGYIAQFLYEGDSPLAERRAAALALDPTLLGELLGTADLRDLLDPEAVDHVVASLQRLTEETRCRDVEDAADLLRILGPMSDAEAGQRGVTRVWLDELEGQRRVFRARLGGREIVAAVEDAARLRDALGVPLPPGLPEAHLRAVPDPISDVVDRYARTHGPFTPSDLLDALRLPPAVLAERLARAVSMGRIVEGQFLRDEAGIQFCQIDVLRRIKRRSAALLRREMEPVGPAALAEFLLAWQHLTPGGAAGAGSPGVLEAVNALAGAPVPASALEVSILPSRVPGYLPAMLDELTSCGQVTWVGVTPLPGSDGRVALIPAGSEHLLPNRSSPTQPTAIELAVLDLLSAGGGWFFPDVVARVCATVPGPASAQEVADALMSLVWAGAVSNDSLAPVRALVDRRASRRRTAVATPAHARPPRGRYAGLWRASRGLPPSSGSVAGADSRGRTTPLSGPLAARMAGRWFALPEPPPADPMTSLGRAHALLNRFGLVTRATVTAAGEPGGFAAIYRTLSAMEESGHCQRVYAVQGLGAAQFALPGVVDRLRQVQRDLDSGRGHVVVLAAADPANPYGAAVDWPPLDDGPDSTRTHRPSRAAGAHVVLVHGVPALFIERGGHSVIAFPPGQDGAGDPFDSPDRCSAVERAAREVASAVKSGTLPGLDVTRINGEAALSCSGASALHAARAFRAAGFVTTPRGLRFRTPS